MIKFILRFILIALTLLAIAGVVPGIVVETVYTALVAALIWGIIGVTIKPVLQLVALPVTLLSFGLFAFVINALLFWLVAALIPGFSVSGFIPALEGSLILTAVNWALHLAL